MSHDVSEHQGAHNAGVKAYLELMDQDDSECVCEDCVVRTVLEATYEKLRTLVLEDEVVELEAGKTYAFALGDGVREHGDFENLRTVAEGLQQRTGAEIVLVAGEIAREA